MILAESSGFGSARVIALLCVSFLRRHRVLLVGEQGCRIRCWTCVSSGCRSFAVANVVAFCAYFATFAVFFFTALYLEEVVGYTGYQIAQVFLPMMVLMAVAALLAGRWTITAGPKWSIFTGCLLFALGLLLTSFTISPNPSYLPLAAALSVTGIGVGSTVVPATSSALSAVPPERSGMAASATNTSREIGAVTGVAVLGALVSARLSADIASRLQALGLPKSIQQIVINGVETGLEPSSGHGRGCGRSGWRWPAQSWSRRSSRRPTAPSSPGCMRRCTSPRRSSCWPGCSASSGSAASLLASQKTSSRAGDLRGLTGLRHS